MAIAIDGSTTLSVAAAAGGFVTTVSHDNGTGTDRFTYVSIATQHDNAGDGVSAVTYDGAAMTEISRSETVFGGKDGEITGWFIVAGSTGTNDVSISYVNSGAMESCCVSVTTFIDVDQADPIGAVATPTTGNSSTNTVTLTTEETNSWVICSWSWHGGDTDPFSSSDTELVDQASGANTFLDTGHPVQYEIATATGSYSVTATASVSDTMAGIGFELKEAVAAGGGRIMSSLVAAGGLAGQGGIAGKGGGLAG